jgi:predicted transcriptional regulator
MKSITVKRLEILMSREGETANSFSKKVGVSSTAIYNLIEGGHPRTATIDKIVAAFPTYSKEWLLGTDVVSTDDSNELQKLREENAWLKKLVENLTSAGKVATNFLRTLILAGANNIVRVRVA